MHFIVVRRSEVYLLIRLSLVFTATGSTEDFHFSPRSFVCWGERILCSADFVHAISWKCFTKYYLPIVHKMPIAFVYHLLYTIIAARQQASVRFCTIIVIIKTLSIECEASFSTDVTSKNWVCDILFDSLPPESCGPFVVERCTARNLAVAYARVVLCWQNVLHSTYVHNVLLDFSLVL